MQELRIQALALHLECDVDDLEVSSYDDQIIENGGEEYLVVTDDEADELWEQSLDNYLEECIYPELPDSMKGYFDDNAWKRDARYDGRAHSLSTYDGDENEVTLEVETFYIYRTN